jgi:hypothetical protein
MSAGGDIHGAQIPSPKWWRPIRDVPLIVLAILSVAAAVIGWVTQYRLDVDASQPAAIATSPASDSVSAAVNAACRAPVTPPASQPWIDGDGSAEQIWSANADNLADPVVIGNNGWAFYNDQIEQNFSQALGRRYLTVQEATAWHDYFTSVAEALASQGIEFTIEITPSAASVYPQELPDWTSDIRGSTPLDQFLASSPELPIIDFRAGLREASAQDAVYTPVNSHWTDWGGYIGWQTYAACQAALHPGDDAIWVPAVSGVRSSGVFNEYASYGVPDAAPEWTSPIFAEDFAQVEVTDSAGLTTVTDGEAPLDLSTLPGSTRTADSRSDKTALVLRDSMGNALSPYWAQEYAQTWQIQHRFDDWSSPPNFKALVDQYHPDVVIVQMAERHLMNAPTAASGY